MYAGSGEIWRRIRGNTGRMVTMKKRKTGKEQVAESYQPGNVGSMSGPIPSIKKKRRRPVESGED
ncbi:MAG: hypothetical protein C4K49_01200 [Candidatus Thorarchaeota archaeon]|nr:MAG: hypothetical protein C4K49_01200 [Candidatus Thorarchaeota archaeon]